VSGNLLMMIGTLPAARGIPGQLAATLGVLGRRAGAHPMARTDAIWNSFFVEFPVRGCVPAMRFLLPRRLHAV
jgi:hypothetical protein